MHGNPTKAFRKLFRRYVIFSASRLKLDFDASLRWSSFELDFRTFPERDKHQNYVCIPRCIPKPIPAKLAFVSSRRIQQLLSSSLCHVSCMHVYNNTSDTAVISRRTFSNGLRWNIPLEDIMYIRYSFRVQFGRTIRMKLFKYGVCIALENL